MNFFGALINAAAEAAKAAAHAQAGSTAPRSKGTACTPCAAHAYVDRVRAQYAPPPARPTRKRK